MTEAIDGVLLLGFGGVTDECCGRAADCPGRVECFVAKVLGDDPAQAPRLAEVAAHYHALGGVSPYNALTLRQAQVLEAELARRGHALPVRCGFRNWRPWYRDGLDELAALGCRRIATCALAPHRCRRSWEQYHEEARAAAADHPVAIVAEAAPWSDHPGYLAASAERIRDTAAPLGTAGFAEAALLLTAHAIPVPAERTGPYRAEVEASAVAIAAAAGHPAYHLAFQSAPDRSRVPWSTPTVEQALEAIAAAGHRVVVVQAIGFLVDHVEVLYDLDHEAAERCRDLGLAYHRAPCVHDHPQFIACLADALGL